MKPNTLLRYTDSQIKKALQKAGFNIATCKVLCQDFGFLIKIGKGKETYHVELQTWLWDEKVVLLTIYHGDHYKQDTKTPIFETNATNLSLRQVVKLIQATISQHIQEEYEKNLKAIGVWQEPNNPINKPLEKES